MFTSLQIPRIHPNMDSTLSILSHNSDTSHPSSDSLESSRDYVDFSDEMATKSSMLNDSLERVRLPENGGADKHVLDSSNDSLRKDVTDKHTDTIKDLSDTLNNNNNNNNSSSNNTNNSSSTTADEGHARFDRVGKQDGQPTKTHVDTPITRSKVPKSKTFDSSVSIFNHKTAAKTRFQNDDLSHRGTSGSGNHVFMTSQECMVVPGCSKLPRETIASRLRFEKQHSTGLSSSPCLVARSGHGYHKNCVSEDGYMTPLQRKEILIKDMKRQVRELNTACEAKDREISMYKQHVDENTSRLVQNKDAEISRLRDELKELKQSYDDISSFCEESVATASVLEQKTEELKHAMDNREKQHQKLYLEMYRKGQDSAKFERQEELERLAGTSGGCKVTISELVKKLAWTELELAKWQTIKRHESYHDATRLDTEADATLRFLKDSFFHYITDEKEADHHLRAIVKIFKYTEAQMARIKESRLIVEIEKRHRKKSKR